MKRSKLTHAAMLAALTLFAGAAGATNFFGNTIGVIYSDEDEVVTVEQCQEAWAASSAYGQCGDRSSLPGSGDENVYATGPACTILTSCECAVADTGSGSASDVGSGVYKLTQSRCNTQWQSGPDQLSELQNCNGTLKVGC